MWRGMNYKELYTHVGPQYEGNVDAFRSLMRRSIVHLSIANESYVSFPTPDEWLRHNTGKGMEKFPKTLILFIDGTSWPLLKPGSHMLKRILWVGYKKHHAHRYFIMCTADGRIVYVSHLLTGTQRTPQSMTSPG